jgi:prepilin-type N-terminal cleavage/methylation domain-containing protein
MKNDKGFTLIEIIVTLTLVAVVAAMVLPYLYTTLSQSSTPMWRLRDTLALKQIMENITQDYHTTTLDALQISIGTEDTSQNNNYGSYRVINNRFVQFSSNIEAAGGTNLLKVTIANSAGEQLTTLFYRK